MNKLEFEEKYLNKTVEIIFFDNDAAKGKLEKGDMYFGGNIGWKGKGYHIRDLGFMKSHIKKIEVKLC